MPGPRARLIAQVADGLATYNAWWAEIQRQALQREDALVTVAAAVLPPPAGSTP